VGRWSISRLTCTGEMKSLAKNCSPLSLPSSCLVGTDKKTGEPLKVCYDTCSRDACNWSSASLQQLLNLLRWSPALSRTSSRRRVENWRGRCAVSRPYVVVLWCVNAFLFGIILHCVYRSRYVVLTPVLFQGRSDGGISVYIPSQNQPTLEIFMWLLLVFFSLTQDKFNIVPVCALARVSFTYLHTTIYTPKWNSWLRPCFVSVDKRTTFFLFLLGHRKLYNR